MNRKLLTQTLPLPFIALALATIGGACAPDDPAVTSGGASSGGSGGTATAGSTSGGSTSGGSTTGGSTSGGSTTAGSPAGGTGGTPAGGMGGMAGATGGGGAGGATAADIGSKKNEHGFAFKDSYFLVACTEVAGHDCLTVQGACPNQNAANFEDKGSTFAESFDVGGEAGKTYTVTITVNGVVEGKYYQNGTRRHAGDFSDANAATGGDGWYVGGDPVPSSYNVFKIGVFMPGGTTEVAHYYLNSFPSNSGLESHQTVVIGYEASFDVPGGGVIKYLNQDSNCRAINNCGIGDISGQGCPDPRMVPNEPGLAVPATYGSKPVNASFNVVTQAAQPFHAQMVHVKVKSVVAK